MSKVHTRNKLHILRNTKGDFRQMSWPKKSELLKSWGIVLLLSSFSGALIFAFDGLGAVISKALFL